MERYRFEESALRLMEASCIPFAVYQFVDRRVVTLALSQGFCDLFGFDDRDEAYFVMDNDMYRDTHPDDVSRIANAAVRFATEGGRYEVVYRSKAPGASEFSVVHSFGEHVYTPDGVRLAVVWYTDEGVYERDGSAESPITSTFNRLLREASQLREGQYDSLTGLPNMTYFFELAEARHQSYADEGRTLAVLFFDLDGMKAFNHKYGFAAGDELLRAVAKVLVGFFGNESCGRIGQDHFVACADARGIEARLEELLVACKEANGGRSLPVRVGVYVCEDEGISPSVACDRAKMACDLNRGTYVSTFSVFDEALRELVLRRTYILQNLDHAIERGWIQVFYQPIVRSATRRVCDREALARWVDPERGTISPAEFIPILEDARLIHKLDLHVLDLVLEQMVARKAAGEEVVPVSVNLSRADFDACDIIGEICRRVDEAGIDRSLVNIEITESVVGSDYVYMQQQIDHLHELGFSVWMDDFGSGYSSLDVLQRLDFDLIKFDMHFSRELSNSRKSRVILTELMRMAESLGIETLAEGVESREQTDFLRGIGCGRQQGYFFGKPAPDGGLDLAGESIA